MCIDQSDSITVVSALRGLASKHFYRDAAGDVVRQNYSAGQEFLVLEIPVAGIHDLSQYLLQLEQISPALVIRGAPLAHVDRAKPVYRRLVNFQTPEIGRRWVLIDFDKIRMPQDMDLKRDTLAAIEYLAHLLPVEFHDCSYHYQLSSSAGMGDLNFISAHIWFWLTEPWTDEALKEWAAIINERAVAQGVVGKTLVDTALFNGVQAHYTAAPIFDGVDNPFPVRSALVEKECHAVTIKPFPKPERPTESGPIGPFEPGIGFDAWLKLIGDHPGGMGFRQPILRATASYVATNGRDGTDTEALYQAVRARVLAADRSAHSDAEIEERASRESIIPGIKGALRKYDRPISHRRSRLVHDLPAPEHVVALDSAAAHTELSSILDIAFAEVANDYARR